MKTALASILVLVSINSGASVIKEAWNRSNDPVRMQVTRNQMNYTVGQYNYKKNFNELPLEGKLSTTPWSGDYWPTYKGGITYRWNDYNSWDTERYGYELIDQNDAKIITDTSTLSPAEKYDLYLGRYEFPLTSYERERTNVMRTIESSSEYDSDFEIPTWEGLCHAWAPATIAYSNPGAVTLTNKDGVDVEFGASDVKALLTYFLHYNKTASNFFLGGRCNTNFAELDGEEYDDAINTSVCRDTNAGAFHMVLTNQIGLLDEGFIVDITRDLEVWNQAVYDYKSRIVKETEGASEGAAKGTVKEIEIKTTMYYITEIDHSWSMVRDTYSQRGVKYYHYRVELDKYDNIIGGEWIGFERPDFLWKQTVPQFSGFFEELETIYKASIK